MECVENSVLESALLIYQFYSTILTLFLVMITVFYGSKCSGHRHTIQISWTCICPYPVSEYSYPNVPGCMASHSPVSCRARCLHLVPGKNHQSLIMYTNQIIISFFFCQVFIRYELKRLYKSAHHQGINPL